MVGQADPDWSDADGECFQEAVVGILCAITVERHPTVSALGVFAVDDPIDRCSRVEILDAAELSQEGTFECPKQQVLDANLSEVVEAALEQFMT